MADFVTELAALLSSVEPHVATATSTSPDWVATFGPIWDPRPVPEGGSRPLVYVGIRRHDGDHQATLVGLLQRHQAGREWWSPESLDGMLGAALATIALAQLSSPDAARRLAEIFLTGPAERVAVSALRGLQLESAADIGGILLRKFDMEALADELRLDSDRRRQLEQQLPPFQTGMVLALAKSKADDERAAENLRRRVRATLPILILARPEEDFEWWYEATITFGQPDATLVATIADGYVGGTYSGHQERVDIQVDSAVVQESLKRDSGLRELAALVAALPVWPRSQVSRRLLRAANLLGDSFDGAPNNRFLRRWMAMEALFGDRSSELADRLCERMTVATQPEVKDRAERKTDLKALYGCRSAIAHGGDEPRIEQTVRTWFRMLCLNALINVANSGARTDDELFTRLNRAKFEGAAFA